MIFKPKRQSLIYLPLFCLVILFVFASSRFRFTVYRDEQPIRISHDIDKDHSIPPLTSKKSEVSKTRRRHPVAPQANDIQVDTEARNEKQVGEQVEKQATDDKPTAVRYCDTHNSTDRGPCIFDIGLNNGQDSKHYLESSPTSRVVAIEANPTLVSGAKKKLREHVDSGRLKILNIGLVGNETKRGETREKLTFWINTFNDVFSSFRQETGCRGPLGVLLPKGNTTYCRKIEMDTMSCSELIREYGTPYYMKVDIEGLDRDCVAALGNVAKRDRPKYISKENVGKGGIEKFASLGYTKFKVVNQNRLQRGVRGTDLEGYSGPWGEGAEDLWIGKQWHSREEVLGRLPLPETIDVFGKQLKGWYDLHAKK